MKIKVLRWICACSEKCCRLFHWLNPITSWLGLGHCHLANFSEWLDSRYNLGVWGTSEVASYQDSEDSDRKLIEITKENEKGN